MSSPGKLYNYTRIAQWIIFIVALIFILPYLVLDGNCYIRLHDTLEAEWEWLKLLVDSHTAFRYNTVWTLQQIMNGQPRNVYPAGTSINVLLVFLLGSYKAYITSSLLMRFIGFTGTVVLLRDYFIKEPENRFIILLCALSFSVLSVFIPFGLSVMGQPLMLWVFLNLQYRVKLSYTLLILFPAYCSVVWFLIPFGSLLVLTGLYFYRTSQLSKHFLIGLVLLTGLFGLINYPMVSTTLIQPGFISHRIAYNLYMFEKPGFWPCLIDTFTVFGLTHYHVATFISFVAFIGILLVIKPSEKLVKALLAGIIAVCIIQGFYPFFEYWLGDNITIIKSLRLNRFSILLPFLWLFAFAISLQKMSRSQLLKPLVFPLLMAQLFLALAGNDELIQNYRTLTGHQKFPGYENYMAPQQFEAIKAYIGKPQSSYRVACLGMSPSVPENNGFYTLDAVMSLYDLRYKQQFRNIFAGEIAKSREIEQYYDGWGNRCYIFSSELGTKHKAFNCYKFTPHSVEHFAFNAQAFSVLGGKYLISAVEIKNHDDVGLHFEKIFTDNQSWWKIYLYSVKPDL
jgi:Protein of unknown function (DUF6044)